MGSLTKVLFLFLACFTYGTKSAGTNLRRSLDKSALNIKRTNYTVSPISTSHEKLKISVYYETFCPASVDFFVTELGPTVKYLGSYIDVHMVPYGHVKESVFRGRKVLRCQHGPDECLGNKIHACVVDVVTNTTEAVLFNVCLMQYTLDNFAYFVNFYAALNSCGYKHNVVVNDVEKCVHSGRSDMLFKSYGEDTNNLFKQYDGDTLVQKYVPYVVFKNHGLNRTKDRSNNFLWNVCNEIHPRPKLCGI